MQPESTPQIQAAALDLDGTIIGPDQRITPAVRDAVARLSARVPVFIATGREPHDVINYARQLGLTTPQLSDGGAAILDPVAGKHIWSAGLGPELASQVLALIQQLNANFVATHIQGTFRRVSDIPDRNIVRISALDLSREAAQALTARFQTHPRMSVILASLPYNGLWAVDFTRAQIDKGSGIARVGQMLNVSPSNMACVGDSYNDLPMLRACGLPIAMGNAPPEIRAAANFTAPPTEQDGLAHAIDHWILPQISN